MITGQKTKFCIESEITEVYEDLGLLGLGFFVIYIQDQMFGIRSIDATALACSYNSVQQRLLRRGQRIAPFAGEPAIKIADAFRKSCYSLDHENDVFFGIPGPQLSNMFYSKNLVMAPDGDEAFDDGSYILQFDLGTIVRLIGFKIKANTGDPDLNTLKDLHMEADEFYGILENWWANFDIDRNKRLAALATDK